MFRFSLVIIFFFGFAELYAQVSGFVMDAENNQPLPDVQVMSKTDTVLTNAEGRFEIDMENSDSVFFQLGGYFPLHIYVEKTMADAAISLLPKYSAINEINVAWGEGRNYLKKIPASISMVGDEQLSSGSQSMITPYFNRLPGVFLHEGANNTNRLVIRGVGSRTPYGTNRVKVYYENIPLTNGNGESAVEEIDPAFVSRLEVLKGPTSALYGAGLGGTVRMFSGLPSQGGFSLKLNTEAGSFATFKNAVVAGYKKENFTISVGVADSRTSGFRENSNYSRTGAKLEGEWNSKKQTLRWLFYGIDLNAQIPSSLDKETFESNPNAAAANWAEVSGFEAYQKMFGGVSLRSRPGGLLVNNLSLSASVMDKYESRPFNILNDLAAAVNVREFIEFYWLTTNLQIGGEAYFERYNWEIYATNTGDQGELLQKNTENRYSVNLFSLFNMDITNRLSFSAGLNANYTTYSLTDQYEPDSVDVSGNFTFSSILSPRIGFTFALSPRINLYTSFGHGYSYPTSEEALLPEGLPNTGLKPEQGWSLEVGNRGSWFNDRFVWDANVYVIFLRDLLVTERETEDIFYGENAGSTRHYGLELNTSMEILRSAVNKEMLTLRFAGTVGAYRFHEFTDDGIDYSGNELPGIPMPVFHSFLKFIAPTIPLETTFSWNYAGKQYVDDANATSTDTRSVLNFRLSYQMIYSDKWNAGIYTGIENVFDARYASMVVINAPSFGSDPRYYYPGKPRSYYIGMNISF